MGERLHGMQEVSGSIPLTSTKKNDGQRLNDKTTLYNLKLSEILGFDPLV